MRPHTDTQLTFNKEHNDTCRKSDIN